MKRLLWLIVLAAIFAGPAYADFNDEFNSPVPDPGWRIINEDTNYWSLADRPGFLRIESQFFMTVPVNFFAHVEAIAGNFSVTSKLICHPDSAGQVAMIYADYDTLAQMPWAVVGCGNYLGYGTVVLAMLGDSITGAFYPDTLVYLRIRIYEDTVFGEFSPDSQNWTIIRSALNPLFNEHQWSGVMAVNQADLGATPQTPPMNADFDWFHLIALSGVEERIVGSKEKLVSRLTPKPNPFRTRTNIRFMIHDTGSMNKRISLQIYDISGRMVKSFFLPTAYSLLHSVVWDGTDQTGRPVPAGAYFIRLEDAASATVRIVKIR